MNIDFERDNYKFNARVSAIILNKEIGRASCRERV